MNRREFTSAMLASGLAAGPAWANVDQEIKPRIAPFAAIFYAAVLTGRAVIINYILVASALRGRTILGIDTRQEQPQIDEKRSAVGGALGKLTVPTVTQALRGASELGTAHLWGHSIVLAPDAGKTVVPQKVRVVHHDRSWIPERRLRPLGIGNLPLLADVRHLPRIGRMWQSKDGPLLIMLRPSLVAGYD